MHAEAKSLRFLGEGKQLTVPFFQRHYVWNSNNWAELLASFESDEVMPFLGSIILKEAAESEFTIIDGQQRLTTVTILAKALYDCLSSESKTSGSGIRNGIENYLFYRKNSADDFKDSLIKISHSKFDHEAYFKVIAAGMLNSEIIDIDSINTISSNVLQCYKYYHEILCNKGDDYLKTLFNGIFDENRKVFVLIKLGHGDINEQTIFDTINRAGIRLSTADIIKNNLFKSLLDACDKSEDGKKRVYRIYSDNWETVFYQDKETSDIWDEERVFGNVKHSNLEFLLYCIACIKWGEDGDMFPKLETVYDRETEKMGYAELETLAEEIKSYALIFKKYILDFKATMDDERNSEYFKYDDGVRRLLLILHKFGVQMFYPYVLMRLHDVNQDENDEGLLWDFHILESFIVRRKISHRGTNDYTSKCFHIIENGIESLIESDLTNDRADIANSNIKTYLADTKDDAAKMVLFWIELYRRRSDAFDVNALEYKFTLEHIMPRKWDSYWSAVPIMNDGKVYPPDSDEGQAYRNSAIQSIGNKTLLTFRKLQVQVGHPVVDSAPS